MNKEEKQEIKELINLLYNNHISQYGKRKLENYIKELQKEVDKKDKVIDLMAKERAEISDEIPVPAEAIKNYYIKKVEEENE